MNLLENITEAKKDVSLFYYFLYLIHCIILWSKIWHFLWFYVCNKGLDGKLLLAVPQNGLTYDSSYLISLGIIVFTVQWIFYFRGRVSLGVHRKHIRYNIPCVEVLIPYSFPSTKISKPLFKSSSPCPVPQRRGGSLRELI